MAKEGVNRQRCRGSCRITGSSPQRQRSPPQRSNDSPGLHCLAEPLESTVTTYTVCSGSMGSVAALTDSASIHAYITGVGLPPPPPHNRTVRPPQQLKFARLSSLIDRRCNATGTPESPFLDRPPHPRGTRVCQPGGRTGFRVRHAGQVSKHQYLCLPQGGLIGPLRAIPLAITIRRAGWIDEHVVPLAGAKAQSIGYFMQSCCIKQVDGRSTTVLCPEDVLKNRLLVGFRAAETRRGVSGRTAGLEGGSGTRQGLVLSARGHRH